MSKYSPRIIFSSSEYPDKDVLIIDIINFDAIQYHLNNDKSNYEFIKNDDGSFMLVKDDIFIETIKDIHSVNNVEWFKPIIYNKMNLSDSDIDYVLSDSDIDYVLTDSDVDYVLTDEDFKISTSINKNIKEHETTFKYN